MTATAAIAGYSGSVAGPAGVAEVKEWKADITTEALEATSMGSAGWKEHIPGLQGATMSAKVQGTGIPTRGLFAVTLKTAQTGGATISGSAIIEKVGVNVPVNGVITYDLSGKFTGSVTVA